jgi:uncharacterized protein YbjT (DUF2867 family)
MKIVVIGGSGLIGSKLVARLAQRGHEAVAASPSTGVDTITGAGLADAFAGASVVVDVSNAPSWDDAEVLEFFETSTRNQLHAEEQIGVGHHVALSVVGTERMTASGYFRAKLAQETLIAGSAIPFTIVRATQFFEFVDSIADSATVDGRVRVPPALIQPMAAADVADAVCRAAEEAPRRGIVEVGGPEQFRFDELVRLRLEATGDPRDVVVDAAALYYGWVPLEERTLVPGDGAILGTTRFQDWLRDAARAA